MATFYERHCPHCNKNYATREITVEEFRSIREHPNTGFSMRGEDDYVIKNMHCGCPFKKMNIVKMKHP